jgi:histone acetyltransferase (RNA polymerase elongator complex component)
MSDGKKTRPLIVPLFLPNQGCPYRCVYCRQERITGRGETALSPEGVEEILRASVASTGFDAGRSAEIAFYGGTFTGLPRNVMEGLLKAAFPWVTGGPFQTVRVSTRPDALDGERLALLKRYGVSTVELGVQSMDDGVLRRSRRGYASRDVRRAVDLLRRSGLRVGVQLMPGLPGDSAERFLETVDRCLDLRPDLVRLYPALVLEGTLLADWYREGRYRPFGLDEAVTCCAEACSRFESRGVPVVRMGLLAPAELLEEGGVLAGPWHPAFGFLVRSALYRRKIGRLLPECVDGRVLRIAVHPREVPLVRGYRNRGLCEIQEKTGACSLEVVPDESRASGAPKVEAACAPVGRA